jgi:hypothetical protein
LLEVLVPLANGEQYRRRLQDDHTVRLGSDEISSFSRCDGCRDDDTGRMSLARGTNRGKHGRARGKAIIDQDVGLALQL